MFERFTDRARRVVVLAQDEARSLNHNYIGTEHLLLGLITEGEGVAAKALESLDIIKDAVRAAVIDIIGEGEKPVEGHIPFTPRAKRVFELSLREALQLGHNYIGTLACSRKVRALLRRFSSSWVPIWVRFARPSSSFSPATSAIAMTAAKALVLVLLPPVQVRQTRRFSNSSVVTSPRLPVKTSLTL